MTSKTMPTQVAVSNRIIKFNFANRMMILVHEGVQANLLQIFYQYPNIEFTLKMIADKLKNTSLSDIEGALGSLVDTELVKKHTRQGLVFYSLTTNLQER